MTRRLWFLFALLAALTFCQSSEAQPIPTWKNDAQGRPAPPCMVLDAATGISTPCSSTNPLPTGGGGTGQGTTAGTTTTGFGKNWFPSTVVGSVAAGEQMAAFFTDDLNVAFLRRSTGCANCLQVALSADGGITGTFFSTAAILGNSVSTAHRVPTSPPRYLVSSVGGPLNIFHSLSLTGGWAAVAGLTTSVNSWASNAAGTTVLSYASPAVNVEVCRSTDGGVTFGSCAVWGAASTGSNNGTGITFAGGTTWLFTNGAGNIWRSANDGVTFTLITTLGGNGRGLRCLSPTYATCLYTANDQNVYRSADAGLTWAAVQNGVGTNASLCDYGSGIGSTLSQNPPIGFAAVVQNAFTALTNGLNWFSGQTSGSHWDGTGVPSIRSLDCRGGRGIATYSTTGGGTNVFAVYNPLTQPGGVLQSSAGGYNVSTLIQSGVILNTTPVTSAAATPAVVMLTNTAGSRICIREIALISSAASAVVTLTVTDGATVVLNYGTPATGIVPIRFNGSPLVCSQTSNNLVVNIGSAGGAITTTTSVIADRYPD